MVKRRFLPIICIGVIVFICCIGLAILLTLSSAALTSAQSSANTIRFDHLSVEQGLSSNGITGIVQDNRGFMWFSANDGLNRYDGYDFKVYRHDPEDPGSLSDNFIRILYKDRTGDLWIGTLSGGLNRFDRETEKFIRYQHDPQDPHSLSHDEIRSIYEDETGTLWIGTNGGGLNRFDRNTGQFIHYRYDSEDPLSLGHDVIFGMYEDRAGVLWIGTAGGLNRFDRDTETFRRYQHNPDNPNSLSSDRVRAMYEDQEDRFWIATLGGGLDRFDREAETFQHYQHNPDDPTSLSDNFIITIYEDGAGVLWIGTTTGVDRFDRDTGTFAHSLHDSADPNSLSSNVVLIIYEDRSGIVWIGTDGGGVNRFDREKKMFTHYQHDSADLNSLSHNDVLTMYEDRTGALWICTNGGGLDKFDRETGTFTHYQHDPDNSNSLSHNMVYAVLEDRMGMIWIGTFGGGLDKFDPETELFTHYRHDPNDPQSLSNDMITSIYEDQSGILWVGTWNGGLNQFDPQSSRGETETFKRYQHDPADSSSLSDNFVISIYEDRTGVLWIGTFASGLNRFDPRSSWGETETFRRYQNDPDNSNSLSHDGVYAVYENPTGVLWVATGGGLNKLILSKAEGEGPNRQIEQFIHYRKNDGLPSDGLCGILEDQQGNLWLSTNQGLSKFNPQMETFRNYDVSDGLQSNQFNILAYGKSRNGEMFFGGPNGFNAFYPEQITDNPHIPPIVITNFQLANKPFSIDKDSVLQKSIVETNRLILSYQDRVFSFEFAALNYRVPEKNRYKYTLEGFEDEWNEVDSTRRYVTYTNLDPGDYVFRVIGSNNDGVWNEEGISVEIIITPPFWATWWFRGMIAVLVVGFAVGGHRWRVRAIERQRRQLEIQVTERTQELATSNEQLTVAKEKALEAKKATEVANQAKSTFLANMSHELRTPLNAVLGFSQLMERDPTITPKHREYLGIINSSGDHLLELINDVLELSKIEAGQSSLVTTSVDLYQTLESLEAMMRIRAEKKGLELIFERTPDVPQYIKTDERKLRQILINLLGNAVKFTEEGKVSLPFGF